MKLNFHTLKSVLLLGGAILLTTSCSKEDKPVPPAKASKDDFQLAYANGSGSHSQIILQGVPDLSKGVITFEKKGYNMSSARTARIFTSTDRSTIYSLNYRVGTVDKLEYMGGDNYEKRGSIDASKPLNNGVRFTKINDKVGSLHDIKAEAQYAGPDKKEYIGHKMLLTIGLLDLESMTLKKGDQNKLEIKIDESLTKEGYYIDRIDSPVISNGKLYYGARVRKFDASTGKRGTSEKTLSLVLDYNDLSKVSVIETSHVAGSTNGYRTPMLHKNEAGEILQMVVNKSTTYITKIKDGKYDQSYTFNLNEALGGKKTNSNGWFYVGNGIGYVPYEKLDEPQIEIGVDPDGNPSFSADWGLARIDLKNGTAVDLETPKKLWLEQYQSSIVRDGKFYIALAPFSGKGNIYMFDINSTASKGEKGAEITSGADQYYIGIY